MRTRRSSARHALVLAACALPLLLVAGAPPAYGQQIFAYVANHNSNSISKIDTATNSVVGTIPLTVQPRELVVSPDNSKLYVTSCSSGQFLIVDIGSSSVVGSILLGNCPVGVKVTPDGTRAYVVRNGAAAVDVVDVSTTSPTLVTTVNVGSCPYGVAISPDGTRAYVANQCSSAVTVIDTTTNPPSVMTSLSVGSNPLDVAFTSDGTRALVTNQSSNTVSVIDTSGPFVSSTVTGSFSCPVGISITPDATRAFVANQCSNFATVIDLSSAPPAVLTTVVVGSSPWGVAITPDGGFAYVTNLGSNSTTVINTSTNVVATTVAVGSLPFGVAITPSLADVSVTKLATPDPVITGSNVTYTINVTNSGPQAAESVVVSDVLDPNTTFVSCVATGTGACGGAGNNRTISFTSIAPSTTETITLVAQVNASVADGTIIGNSASATSDTPDPDGGNNSDSVAVTASNPPPILACPANMVVPATSSTGAVVTYPPASVSDNTAGTTVLFSPPSGSLLPIGTTIVTATATDSGGASTTCAFTVAVVTTDLAVSKSASEDPVRTGRELTYTITVHNFGPSTAGSVLLNDPLPLGTTFVSVSPGAFTCTTPLVGAAGTVSCGLSSLTVGSNAAIQIVVEVTARGKTTISNTASVSAAIFDHNPANNSATLETRVSGSRK